VNRLPSFFSSSSSRSCNSSLLNLLAMSRANFQEDRRMGEIPEGGTSAAETTGRPAFLTSFSDILLIVTVFSYAQTGYRERLPS
jgi:hypothetical protein